MKILKLAATTVNDSEELEKALSFSQLPLSGIVDLRTDHESTRSLLFCLSRKPTHFAVSIYVTLSISTIRSHMALPTVIGYR